MTLWNVNWKESENVHEFHWKYSIDSSEWIWWDFEMDFFLLYFCRQYSVNRCSRFAYIETNIVFVFALYMVKKIEYDELGVNKGSVNLFFFSFWVRVWIF